MSFQNFPLHETLLANITETGFTEPTQIQSEILPLALEGKDVSGLSRTGTGKTAAFLIPTLHRLTQLPPDRLALCLSPTRELAQQIQEEADRLGKGLGFGTVSVVGGMSSEDQIRCLRNGARLLTGTPGRIIDLYKERAFDLAKVDILVFDEADRMFDMGFIRDMQYLLSKVNPQRQILLFSATMNFSVLNLIYEYGSHPQEVNVSRDQMTADNIQQVLYHVGDQEKAASLLAVCRKHSPEKGTIIVFVNYKERVPWVAAFLTQNGIPAEGLSSLLRQERRNKIIAGFKGGKFRALVATDVASRGLDVDDISLVVNYHLPEEAATYVHRIGRTARAGKDGIAVAICSSEDAYNQMRVEEFLGNKIPVQWLGEEEMPKEVNFPRRDSIREDEGGEAPGSRPREGRGPRDGGRGRTRDARGPRAPREDRAPRAPRAPREEAPAIAAMDAVAAPVSAPVAPRSEPRRENTERVAPAGRPERTAHAGDRPERGPRRETGERHERGDRPERGGERHRGGRGRDRRPPREDFAAAGVAPANLPSPLTGSPVIYCMKSGKPKNLSEDQFRVVMANYDRRFQGPKISGKKKAAPAIIKKISSKVTALFGNRGK